MLHSNSRADARLLLLETREESSGSRSVATASSDLPKDLGEEASVWSDPGTPTTEPRLGSVQAGRFPNAPAAAGACDLLGPPRRPERTSDAQSVRMRPLVASTKEASASPGAGPLPCGQEGRFPALRPSLSRSQAQAGAGGSLFRRISPESTRGLPPRSSRAPGRRRSGAHTWPANGTASLLLRPQLNEPRALGVPTPGSGSSKVRRPSPGRKPQPRVRAAVGRLVRSLPPAGAHV